MLAARRRAATAERYLSPRQPLPQHQPTTDRQKTKHHIRPDIHERRCRSRLLIQTMSFQSEGGEGGEPTNEPNREAEMSRRIPPRLSTHSQRHEHSQQKAAQHIDNKRPPRRMRGQPLRATNIHQMPAHRAKRPTNSNGNRLSHWLSFAEVCHSRAGGNPVNGGCHHYNKLSHLPLAARRRAAKPSAKERPRAGTRTTIETATTKSLK
jgi:hypothetical protein